MGASFPARVLAAERIFFEKALLLHEETFRPADKSRKIRMARHYYDVWCLITRGEMFFGEVPTFDEILRVVGDFEKRFNQLSPA